ncbi:porin family protein [Flammeovirga kamogawensis]|uniref:Porin family protein n=1 Tax=Flammeovirga kamogawensis TaxID=373891 RepID=A0ABX8GWT8_9BACT|nr:hypothetical protein [Flammeovirga kamogawensis]MBB6460711.1 long-subunit fatty acid transport protein [Flammeovirga kamogawensis]QWG08065.1 porin family protein [Flammeovirga kamogawensis]TRX69871.1 hypothetical protein EO216_17710 [Flammeovirga kamogawensis]
MKTSSIQKITLIFITLISLISLQSNAQSKASKRDQDFTLTAGNSIRYSAPIKGFETDYNYGVGVYLDLDYKLTKGLSVRGDFGWSVFKGKRISDYSITPDLNDWEFSGGLKYKFSILYVEGLAGYRTGFESVTYAPGAGIEVGNFNIGANYNIIDQERFMSYKLTFFW